MFNIHLLLSSPLPELQLFALWSGCRCKVKGVHHREELFLDPLGQNFYASVLRGLGIGWNCEDRTNKSVVSRHQYLWSDRR